ncbi:MAG: DUF1565 domain-containing protein, partial [Bacteroidales bacterium]|nr:DUF1565 domain-containing protein [Bacteroidales bacterium]
MGRKIIITAVLSISILSLPVYGQKAKKPKNPVDTTTIVTPVDSAAIEVEYAVKAAESEMMTLSSTTTVTLMMVSLPTTYNYYVAKNGLDSNPGTEAQPFATIQKAIDVAVTGNAIKVKEGIYYENIDYKGKSLKIVGSPENPNLTTIDGRGVTHVVQMIYKENTSTLLSGFTITNGKATSMATYHTNYGGGIYLFDNAKPTLSHLIIKGNTASVGGALAALHSASPTLENVLICDNTASAGAAAYFYNGVAPKLYNVTIAGNQTTSSLHGAFYLSRYANAYLYNCISWNTESTYEVSFNSSSSYNGPCTVYFTYSDNRGGQYGLVNRGTSGFTMTVSWPTGNISSNPLFFNYNSRDFNLASGSPCIDAGNALTEYNDVNFPPSQGTVRNDMGMSGGPSTWVEPHVTELVSASDFTPYQSDNYIFSKTKMHKTGGGTDYKEVFQYFDGLGRPLQTVDYKASPKGNDIVQPMEYDPFGREAKKYLPYASTDAIGTYRSGWKTEQAAFYTNTMNHSDGNYAYSETVFDNSPLNRVMKQGAPGNDWKVVNTTTERQSSENVISYQYLTNIISDSAYYWTISGTYPTVTFTKNSYASGTLYKTVVSDENNNPVTEFKDIQGKVVLKTDALGGKTYYIYDNFELLRCVIPPLASQTLNKEGSFITSVGLTVFNELCYYYEYDYRNRMTIKKLPGTIGVYTMLYDDLDRLIQTEDPNGNRIYTKYDIFSRPIETGNAITGAWLTKTHYDSYSKNGINYTSELPYNKTTYGYGYTQITSSTALKGKVTATITRVLDPIDGIKDSIRTVNYYDKYGRIIQTVSDNHTNGREIVSHLYKYKNGEQVEKTKYCHWKGTTTGSPSHIIEQLFTYDHAGRLKSTDEIINNNKVRMSEMVYGEDGTLHAKRIGNSLQTVDYNYNIRGWLREMNAPYTWGDGAKLFNMRLYYGNHENYSSYNGNITEMIWSDNVGKLGYYTFEYDKLNCLKNGFYQEWYQGTKVITANDKYKVGFTYDANGNILTANRRGIVNDATGLIGNIDVLTYKYFNSGKSNRLWAVKDDATDIIGRGDFVEYYYDGYSEQEFGYDHNGNMIYDYNKDAYINYNYLNLPNKIEDGDAHNIFKISYNATGMKLRQSSYLGTLTTNDYIGPFVYKDGNLDYIITSEGRAVYTAGVFNYFEYHLKDHLGNVRVAFRNNNGTAEVLQRNDYYPFGMLMGEREEASVTNKNKYLYNGKEQFRSPNNQYMDLFWYDYGA